MLTKVYLSIHDIWALAVNEPEKSYCQQIWPMLAQVKTNPHLPPVVTPRNHPRAFSQWVGVHLPKFVNWEVFTSFDDFRFFSVLHVFQFFRLFKLFWQFIYNSACFKFHQIMQPYKYFSKIMENLMIFVWIRRMNI